MIGARILADDDRERKPNALAPNPRLRAKSGNGYRKNQAVQKSCQYREKREPRIHANGR
jgi:hypothetical protein